MSSGVATFAGSETSLKRWLAIVNVPIRSVPVAVNRSVPAGPAAIDVGRALGSSVIGYSVIAPAGVTRPIESVPLSANQRSPPGPATRPWGEAPWALIAYSVTLPRASTRPIRPRFDSVNQSAPSAPAAMFVGPAPEVGMRYRATWRPAGATRPSLTTFVAVTAGCPVGVNVPFAVSERPFEKPRRSATPAGVSRRLSLPRAAAVNVAVPCATSTGAPLPFGLGLDFAFAAR